MCRLLNPRSAHDRHGRLVLTRVEELFRRFAKILHLHAGGRVIRTTAEHPFHAKGTGWTPAGALRVGDEVWTDDGRWVGVEEVYDTGEYEPVYNLRVADFHTYFVGDDGWGWGLWAHNTAWSACTCRRRKRLEDIRGGNYPERAVEVTEQHGRPREGIGVLRTAWMVMSAVSADIKKEDEVLQVTFFFACELGGGSVGSISNRN